MKTPVSFDRSAFLETKERVVPTFMLRSLSTSDRISAIEKLEEMWLETRSKQLPIPDVDWVTERVRLILARNEKSPE